MQRPRVSWALRFELNSLTRFVSAIRSWALRFELNIRLCFGRSIDREN